MKLVCAANTRNFTSRITFILHDFGFFALCLIILRSYLLIDEKKNTLTFDVPKNLLREELSPEFIPH